MPALLFLGDQMSREKQPPADPKGWEPATRLVRGGTVRASYGETAEALYLTQSFVYDSAEAADARFAGDEPGLSSIPATATRPSRCSRSAWRCSKAPRTAARPRRAWRRCTWR